MKTNRIKSTGEIIGEGVGELIKSVCNFSQLYLLVLRACDVINWSWYQVMLPTFIRWCIAAVVLLFIGTLTIAERIKK